MKSETTTTTPAAVPEGQKPQGDNISASTLSTLFASARKGKREPAGKPAAGQGEPPAADPANPEPHEDPNPNPDPADPAKPDPAEPQDPDPNDPPNDDPADPAAEPQSLDEVLAALKDIKGGAAFKNVVKRIHTLASEKNEARQLSEQLAQENNQLRQQLERGMGAGAGADPVSGHPQVQKIDQALRGVMDALSWLEENPEGGQVADGKGGTVEIDAKRAAKLLKDMERERTKLETERDLLAGNIEQQHQAAEQQWSKVAVEAYPWMKDENSPEYLGAAKAVQMFPELKRSASWKLMIADWWAGRQARENAKPAAKPAAALPTRKPAAAVEPTPQPGVPGAKPPSQDAGEKQLEKREEDFKKSGRAGDLGKVFAERRRLRSGNHR